MSKLTDRIKQSKPLMIVLGIVTLIIVGVAGFVAYKLYDNTKKLVTYSTECFSIAVPAKYKASPRSSTCQFSAYTGPDKKSPENLVLLLPYKTPINSEKTASETLKQQAPSTDKYVRTLVGKVPAITGISFNSQADGSQKQLTTYIIYGTPIYSPSGSKYKTNAFAAEFLVRPVDKSEVQRIIDSVRWK